MNGGNMIKKLSLIIILFVFGCTPEQNSYDLNINQEPVPISELPYFETVYSKPGWEERSPEFIKWNSTGVRIDNPGGSGTMSHYDPKENWMYIISCGHLFFEGTGSVDFYQKNPRTEKISVFYHNDKKLKSPKNYNAEVVCHIWKNNIHDVSLLRFKPDWENPWVTPMVSKDYTMSSGTWYHNVGCDGKSEVAHYLVKFSRSNVRNNVEELICVQNVARGGRSGGGLITDDQKLVGITSRSDRISTSYYTSFKQIHQFLTEQKFEFVLIDKSNLANKIPIIDRNNPQGKYPPDYIPLPN
jgi:hypothetical protein